MRALELDRRHEWEKACDIYGHGCMTAASSPCVLTWYLQHQLWYAGEDKKQLPTLFRHRTEGTVTEQAKDPRTPQQGTPNDENNPACFLDCEGPDMLRMQRQDLSIFFGMERVCSWPVPSVNVDVWRGTSLLLAKDYPSSFRHISSNPLKYPIPAYTRHC